MAVEWNEEQIAMIATLWNSGMRAAEISPVMSEAFGVLITRNAVIGKVNRLRKATDLITRAHMTVEQIKAEAEAARAVQRIRRERREAAGLVHFKGYSPNNFAGFTINRRQVKPVPKPVATVVDVSEAKVWTERKFGECAAPVSGEGAETMSCCARTFGKTYCAAHQAIFFRKPEDTGSRFVNGVARFAA
jgi:hypothetical protein